MVQEHLFETFHQVFLFKTDTNLPAKSLNLATHYKEAYTIRNETTKAHVQADLSLCCSHLLKVSFIMALMVYKPCFVVYELRHEKTCF